MKEFTEILITMILGCLLITAANAQTRKVKINLTVDGKNEPLNSLKAWVTTPENYENLLEMKTAQNTIIVEDEIRLFKTFTLKIILNSHELFLTNLNKNHFDADWDIIIENPTSSTNTTAPAGKILELIYSVRFKYRDRDASVITVEVYKDIEQIQTTPIQSLQTKIARIEVDGKEVKKDYKVLFFSNDQWIEANRIATGFIVPEQLRNDEFLSVQIAFGKYKLQFSGIHISKFKQDWTVGIDKKPFSEEFVTPEEAETIKGVYYIQFETTQVIVKERKTDLTEPKSIYGVESNGGDKYIAERTESKDHREIITFYNSKEDLALENENPSNQRRPRDN